MNDTGYDNECVILSARLAGVDIASRIPHCPATHEKSVRVWSHKQCTQQPDQSQYFSIWQHPDNLARCQ